MSQLHRKHTLLQRVLRLVVIPECNLHCFYCHHEGMGESDFQHVLPEDKFLSLLTLFRQEGVQGVSFTGGEPLLYAGLEQLVESVAEQFEADRLHLTTNGALLMTQLSLVNGGKLGRVNVSIPSVEKEKYATITGLDILPKVLKGVEAVKEKGICDVHINSVILKGINDSEQDLVTLLDFWQERDIRLDLLIPYPQPPGFSQSDIVSPRILNARLKQIGAVKESRSFGQFRLPVTRYKYGRLIMSVRDHIVTKDCSLCVACSARSICVEGINNPRISLAGRLKPCLMGPTMDLYDLALAGNIPRLRQRIREFFKVAYETHYPHWIQRRNGLQ